MNHGFEFSSYNERKVSSDLGKSRLLIKIQLLSSCRFFVFFVKTILVRVVFLVIQKDSATILNQVGLPYVR